MSMLHSDQETLLKDLEKVTNLEEGKKYTYKWTFEFNGNDTTTLRESIEEIK